jgi:signal peptidase I
MGDERPGHDHAEASGDPPGEGDNPLGDPPGIERQPGQRPDAEENAPTMRQPPGDDVSDNPPTGPESRGGRHSLRRRPKRRKAKAPWWELPVLVGVAIVVAVLIKTFLIQPFYIPSQSMERTLHGCAGCSGDRILVNKPIYYLRDPHPGDIVVFRAPTDVWFNEPLPARPSNPIVRSLRWFGQLVGLVPPDEHDLVKRVIAVGGQSVKCCDDEGNVQISDSGPNGPWRSLYEPYVSSRLPGNEAKFGPVTVPKGRLWVMGDNRAQSDDSRYHYVNDYKNDPVLSTVPNGDVIGKAVIIAWPPSRWRTLGTPNTFTSAAASALPAVGAGAAVGPLWLLRRRRRGP